MAVSNSEREKSDDDDDDDIKAVEITGTYKKIIMYLLTNVAIGLFLFAAQ